MSRITKMPEGLTLREQAEVVADVLAETIQEYGLRPDYLCAQGRAAFVDHFAQDPEGHWNAHYKLTRELIEEVWTLLAGRYLQ